MDIDEIVTFLAIQETGSISNAAEKLFVSQAAVSQRLRMLENEVGASLFTRQRGYKNTSLTEKGKLFVPIAVRWMNLYQETKMIRRADTSALLAIGCSDSLVTYLLGDLFGRVARAEPNLDLKLRIKNSAEIYADINSRMLDIGLLLHPMNDNNVRAVRIATEKLVLIKYGEDTFFKDVIHTEELDRRKEVYQWWGKSYRVWHDLQFGSLVRSNITVNTVSLMLSVIRKEGAWAVVPYSIGKKLQMTDRFCLYDLMPPPPNRDIFLVVHRDVSPVLQELIDRFMAHFYDYLKDIPWIMRA